MYSQILTPLDGSTTSEQVLPYARSLASKLELPITLLLAVEPENPSVSSMLNPSLHVHQSHFYRSSQAQSYLERIAGEMREEGLSVITLVPTNEASASIVDEAAKDPGTLIAMASHGRSGLARWLMGSIADKVLHTTVNPLLIIRSQSETPANLGDLAGLVAPVDGSELAEQALPHVAHLASVMQLPVDLVRVTLSESELNQAMSSNTRNSSIRTPNWESIAATFAEQADAYLEGLKARLLQQGAPSVEKRVVPGLPADIIVDLTNVKDNCLVVMTTHGRSGVGRMILGSVAERVVRHSGRPVLLIRSPNSE